MYIYQHTHTYIHRERRIPRRKSKRARRNRRCATLMSRRTEIIGAHIYTNTHTYMHRERRIPRRKSKRACRNRKCAMLILRRTETEIWTGLAAPAVRVRVVVCVCVCVGSGKYQKRSVRVCCSVCVCVYEKIFLERDFPKSSH